MAVLPSNFQEALNIREQHIGVGDKWGDVQENPQLRESYLVSPAKFPVDSCLIETLPHFDFVDCVGGRVVEPC